MRFIFTFPDIGEGITEGKIVEWHVEKGMNVQSGDALVQMETDKVVTDIPAPRGGTVAAVFGREGDTVQVGDPLVELDIPDVHGKEAVKLQKAIESERKNAEQAGREAVEEGSAGVVGTIEVAGNSAYLPASGEGVGGKSDTEVGKREKKALATPVARAMAKSMGIDIQLVKGTGPAGRVTKHDIQEYGSSGKAAEQGAGPSRTVPLAQIRKTIAEHMMHSQQSTASMSVFETADAGALEDIRNRNRDRFAADGIRLTFLPFIVKALTAALKNHPYLNSELDQKSGKLILKEYYHIGIAVDTEEGLVVPVIRDADRKSIRTLAGEIGMFAEKAKERSLSLEDMKEGTFSVSNYGALGGYFATPIINYPQAAILGVGRMRRQPIVKNGGVEPGYVLPLSLTADHRIVDGGGATRFLLDVIRYIEEPVDMFLDL